MAHFENITIEKGMYQTKGGLTQALEQLDPSDTDTSAADKPAANQKDKQSAKGFPWWGYMLIAYAVIAVGAAIVVIIIVANKKKPKYPPNMRY